MRATTPGLPVKDYLATRKMIACPGRGRSRCMAGSQPHIKHHRYHFNLVHELASGSTPPGVGPFFSIPVSTPRMTITGNMFPGSKYNTSYLLFTNHQPFRGGDALQRS